MGQGMGQGTVLCPREMYMDIAAARQTFLQYASRYDLNDVKIRLKADHTLRVEELCRQIAQSLGLSQEDTDLACLTGILHDIGRFEQVRIYHTFRDAVSVNHAQFSADLLFRDGLIDDFSDAGICEADRSLIEKAVRLHNAYILPEDLTDRERMFCNILRDADKIDILRVNRETPMTQIYDLPEEAFLDSEISDGVYADLLAHRNVDRANSRTGVDFLMGHIAFVFGLVYPESFRLVREQGYLAKMLSFESRNAATRERMRRIREEVETYLAEAASHGSAYAGRRGYNIPREMCFLSGDDSI